MGTAADTFCAELENYVEGAISDDTVRASGAYVSFSAAKARRERLWEAFPNAVCEMVSEKIEAHLPDLSGTDAALAKLLVRLLTQDPKDQQHEDE